MITAHTKLELKLRILISREFYKKYKTDIINIYRYEKPGYTNNFDLIPSEELIECYRNFYDKTLTGPILINVTLKDNNEIDATAYSYTYDDNCDRKYETIFTFELDKLQILINTNDIIIPRRKETIKSHNGVWSKIMNLKDRAKSFIIDKYNELSSFVTNAIKKKDTRSLIAIGAISLISISILIKVVISLIFPVILVGFGIWAVKYYFNDK